MGNASSQNIINPVNYNCPCCMKGKKLPNIAGRFFIINESQCQCNGCGTIYPKQQFYKTVGADGMPLNFVKTELVL